MRISIIGTGYVGLVSGVGFASKGHDLVCVDIDKEKVDMINRGEAPIYEEGLDELLAGLVTSGKLKATTDTVDAIIDTEITFICVGTPSGGDGGLDLNYVTKASQQVGEALAKKDQYHVVCVKSTVIPGTTDGALLKALEGSSKNVGDDFGLAMNPEFLREGIALKDFLEPDRIVIGGWDKKSMDILSEVYKDFNSTKMFTDLRTAEMIKYVSNALLATKISFANEISRLCEKAGTDVYDVMEGVGLDHRINQQFLNAGCGFGGSCFPKDVRALLKYAEHSGIDMEILSAVLEVNEEQPLHVVNLLEKTLGTVEGKRVVILGLAFKGGTDDVRESRALPMVKELVKKGASVIGYDPEAMKNFSFMVDYIDYADTLEEALQDADACIIQNDWPEFKELSGSDFKVMKNKVVVDGRRLLDPKSLDDDVVYVGVGV